MQTAAEEEMTIRKEQGFQLWHALGPLHIGAGMLLQGRREEALPLLLKGYDAFRTSGAEVRVPAYLGMFGAVYTHSARFEDAHTALNGGLAVAEKNDNRSTRPSLFALRVSCCWQSRTTTPPRPTSARASRRPAASRARRGSCGRRRAWPGSGNGRTDGTKPAPRWPRSTAHTRKVLRRRTSWTPRRYWIAWPDCSRAARLGKGARNKKITKSLDRGSPGGYPRQINPD